MSDIAAEMRKAAELRGDTYSSMEIWGLLGRGADKIERLQAQIDDIGKAAAKYCLMDPELRRAMEGKMSDTFRKEALQQIEHKAWAARQFFDDHDIRADEVKDRRHLDDLEFLLREIERLMAAIAYVRQRSARACEILNEFDNTRRALEGKPQKRGDVPWTGEREGK